MVEVDKERRRREEEAKQQEIKAKASMEAITTTSPSIEATQSGVVTSNTPSKHRKF
jgi:hypothetical protein